MLWLRLFLLSLSISQTSCLPPSWSSLGRRENSPDYGQPHYWSPRDDVPANNNDNDNGNAQQRQQQQQQQQQQEQQQQQQQQQQEQQQQQQNGNANANSQAQNPGTNTNGQSNGMPGSSSSGSAPSQTAISPADPTPSGGSTGSPAGGSPPKASTGKTFFSVGQNYWSEWNDFAQAIRVPAGISIYSNVYCGCLTTESVDLLSRYAASHSGYVEVGLSWKDDMVSNGYSQFEGARLCNDIAGGKYDTTIKKLAQDLAQYSKVKYLLRIDYEVSIELHANTNPTMNDPQTADLDAYKKAFRHVRELFSSCPNIEFVFHAVRGEGKQLYPGDDVVDWNGFSVFNNDVCLPMGPLKDCEGGVADPNLVSDLEWAPKPILIAESAVQAPSSQTPDIFIQYLGRVKDLIDEHDIAGWTYINSNWPAHAWNTIDWGDSRIETVPAVKQWFQANVCENGRFTFDA